MSQVIVNTGKHRNHLLKAVLVFVICAVVAAVFQAKTSAAEPALIEDKALEKAIRDELKKPKGELTQSDLLRLTSLYAYQGEGIESLNGLQAAANLQELVLDGNPVKDISPIAKLTKLEFLSMSDMHLSDIASVAGLTHLKQLNLSGNQIHDLGPLSKLTALTDLLIEDNRIADVRPIAGLSLQWLILSNNALTDIGPLAQMETLEHLYIDGNQISDISALGKLPVLSEVNVQNNPLTQASASLLEQMKEDGVAVVEAYKPPTEISVFIDGEQVEFEKPPIIMNGTTLVPFRTIFENLGLEVEWKADTRTIVGTKNKFKMTLQIDNPTAQVDGNEVKLALAPRIIDGKTFVPLRFVSEATGRDVYWDEYTRSIDITSTFESSVIDFIYSDDVAYVGDMKNGLKDGKGKYIFDGTVWYEGDFVQGKMQGKGKMYDTETQKTFYEGEFLNNFFHGQGKFILSDGSWYEGSFVKGKKEGSGKLYDENGNLISEGEYKRDYRNEPGSLYLADGTKATGTFTDNVLSGPVKEYVKGRLQYDGNYEGGKRNGFGELYAAGKLVYEGDFWEGMAYGQGKYYGTDGSVTYEGEVKRNKMTGSGILYNADGSRYEGEVLGGKPEGEGTLYDKAGKVVSEGLFFDGAAAADPGQTKQTEAYKIRTLLRSMESYETFGTSESANGLLTDQVTMEAYLYDETQLDLFNTLSESGKKQLIHKYVQDFWAEMPEVEQIFFYLSYDTDTYAYAEISRGMKTEDVKVEYSPDGLG